MYFTYSKVDGSYRAEEVKKALKLLSDAGIVKRVSHTAANGLPLGAEVNEKFRKYIYLDSALLLRILDMDLGGARQLTDLIVAGTAEDLVNKGGLAEMVLGWELIKYNSPRSQHDLYYWENTADGTRSEVDYIIARDMKVLPIECKSGTSGTFIILEGYTQNTTNEGGSDDKERSVFGAWVMKSETAPDGRVAESIYTGYLTNYFELKYALEEALGREVDLVEEKAVRNPIFKRNIERTKTAVYGLSSTICRCWKVS